MDSVASQVMVTYVVRPDRAEENQQLVKAVYAELQADQPAGLSYATFVQDDGVTFVHVASIDAGVNRNPLEGVVAFARFREGLDERVVGPPVAITLHRVGSYRAFGG